MRVIEALLLGEPRVLLGGREVTLRTRKALALVAYLAVEGPTPRARLADLLWGDLGEEDARRNLRQELYRLQKTPLGAELSTQMDTVGLRAAQTDVGRFLALVGGGDLGAALDLWRGPFLGGLLVGAAPFEEWLEARREHLDGVRARALDRHAAAREAAGDLRGALAAHLALLAGDPLLEAHQREAIRLHHALGERAAALERYDRFTRLLRDELGLAPLPETARVAEQVRADQTPPQTARAQVGAPQVLRPPLVGRAREWAVLETAGEALVLLLGEPGIGKTRLAEGFAATFGPPVVLRALESARETPLSPVAQALRVALGEPRARERLLALAPVWRREAGRLVPELDPGAGEDGPSAALPSLAGRARFLEALARALLAAAGPGGALLADDLHWADAATAELLGHLARHPDRGGARLLATARPPELERNGAAAALVSALARDGLLTRLPLGALAEPEVLSLLQAVCGGDGDPSLSRRLWRATGGHPLYLLETLRHLLESGRLTAGPGGWHAAGDGAGGEEALPVPPGVREAVLERVARLAPGPCRVLEAASLAGDGFILGDLAPAVALGEWEALEGLETLLASGLLVPGRDQGGYAFSHDLVRRAVEESLSPDRRRLVHGRLAQTLAERKGPPGRIAVHLEQAGRAGEAAPWRVRAAEAASGVFAYREALGHLARALEDGLDPPAAFEARDARVYLGLALGDAQQAVGELNALVRLAGDGARPPLVARAALRQATVAILLGHHGEALDHARRALAVPDLPPGVRAEGHYLAGITLHYTGRLTESLEHADAAFALLETVLAENPRWWYAGYVRGLRALGLALRRDFPGARAEVAAALGTFRRLEDPVGETTALTVSGVVEAVTGNHRMAANLLERAVAQARATGHLPYLRAALTELAELYRLEGDLGRAGVIVEELRHLGGDSWSAALEQVPLLRRVMEARSTPPSPT